MAFLALPLPWVAAELGWVIAEYGRQPWVVQGILPTFMATFFITRFAVADFVSQFFHLLHDSRNH